MEYLRMMDVNTCVKCSVYMYIYMYAVDKLEKHIHSR